jgi:hypothetical protein
MKKKFTATPLFGQGAIEGPGDFFILCPSFELADATADLFNMVGGANFSVVDEWLSPLQKLRRAVVTVEG